MTINKIEALTYDEAKEIAIEAITIKEHECFFCELGEYFGYSILVFKNKKHIYYANDYELHYAYMVKKDGKATLRQWYIDMMNRKLYTDAELLEDVKTYDEYRKKNHFLRNYWIMRFDYLSMFHIGGEKEYEMKKKEYPYCNPVSFCYVKDKSIVSDSVKYLRHLEADYKRLKDNMDAFREMVCYELANHEACITCDYADALNALGLEYSELTDEKKNIVKEELRKQIHNYCNAS